MIPVCRDEISRCPAGTDLTYDYMWKLNFVPARWDSFLPVICLDLYVISLEFSLKPCKNWLGSFYFKAFGTTASPASIFGFIENKFGITLGVLYSFSSGKISTARKHFSYIWTTTVVYFIRPFSYSINQWNRFLLFHIRRDSWCWWRYST